MHFECGGIVGLSGGGEIGAEQSFSEFRRPVSIREYAGCVNEGRALAAVGSDARLESVDHLVRLVVALIEVAEIDIRLGGFAGSDCIAELGLSKSVFFFLFCNES